MVLYNPNKRLPVEDIPPRQRANLSIRLTKRELKKLKLVCMDLGVSMQNFVRCLITGQELFKRRRCRPPVRGAEFDRMQAEKAAREAKESGVPE